MTHLLQREEMLEYFDVMAHLRQFRCSQRTELLLATVEMKFIRDGPWVVSPTDKDCGFGLLAKDHVFFAVQDMTNCDVNASVGGNSLLRLHHSSNPCGSCL